MGAAARSEEESGPPLAPGTEITLIRDGTPQTTLWAGSEPEPVAELQQYLKEMSGTSLPAARPEAGAKGFFVGLDSDFPWLTLTNPAGLGTEGFLLRSDGTNLLLIAHQPAGLRHGVATFLQSLGCRWFFPGKTWEVVPPRRTVTGAWDRQSRPSFPLQRKIWYGYGAYAPCAREFEAWQRHNRMGGPIGISIGHTWHGLDPKRDFAEHPDWFALVDGKRQPTKPCYSHPAVLERAVQYALARAAEGADMISMSPPDGLGYCQCDRCIAVFQGAKPEAKHGTYFARRPDGLLVNVTSETLFRFINGIAAAVAGRYPDVLIGCYAYSAYSHPPSFPLRSNVFVQTTTAFRRTDLTLEEQIDAWHQRTGQIGIRDYYSVYQWDWDYPQAGKLTPAALQTELRFYHDKGVTSINAEASNNWGPRGLGYYLASQLMWDVDADVPALLRDFYEKAFGPAAAVMERYYARWYGPSALVLNPSSGGSRPEGVDDETGARFSLETMKGSFRELEMASELARDSGEYQARIDQLKMYWHYLFLRYRLDQAAATRNEQAILDAIRAELIFGGRLTYSNMIHTRPLIGKAVLRRFKKFESLLANQPEMRKEGQGWRRIGDPPGHEELDRLWQADRKVLVQTNQSP